MTLLVTGAGGFTGRYLISLARAAGMDAVGLQADLTDATAVTDEVVRLQPSKVLHLAMVMQGRFTMSTSLAR
jgi:nucleoside-diphosphate-sugar epimerase